MLGLGICNQPVKQFLKTARELDFDLCQQLEMTIYATLLYFPDLQSLSIRAWICAVASNKADYTLVISQCQLIAQINYC